MDRTRALSTVLQGSVIYLFFLMDPTLILAEQCAPGVPINSACATLESTECQRAES